MPLVVRRVSESFEVASLDWDSLFHLGWLGSWCTFFWLSMVFPGYLLVSVTGGNWVVHATLAIQLQVVVVDLFGSFIREFPSFNQVVASVSISCEDHEWAIIF